MFSFRRSGLGPGQRYSKLLGILCITRVESHSLSQRNETLTAQQDEAPGVFGGLPRAVKLLTWADTPIHRAPASCPGGPEVTGWLHPKLLFLFSRLPAQS